MIWLSFSFALEQTWGTVWFITQAETAEHISKALQQLRNWNPMWNPQFFMTDYSEAELLAFEQTFPGVQIYLCDFHQQQAWKRWTNIHS